MNVGKTILSIRKEKQMSQEEFGGLFHVTRQTVSNWENEKTYPDLQTLVDMSDMFEISLDKLLKEDKQMVKEVSNIFKDGIRWQKIKKIGGITYKLPNQKMPLNSLDFHAKHLDSSLETENKVIALRWAEDRIFVAIQGYNDSYQIDRNGELIKEPDDKWAFTIPPAEIEAICKEHVEELKKTIKTGDEIYKSVYQQ